MGESQGDILKDNKLGYDVFRFFLIAGGIFSAVEFTRNTLNGANEPIAAIMAVVFLGLYFLIKVFPRTLNIALLVMYISTLLATTMSFISEGGMYGRAPFLIINGVIVYIIFFNRYFRIGSIVILTTVTIVLLYFPSLIPAQFTGAEVVKNADSIFLVYMIFISLFIMYIKVSLYRSRKQIKELNRELKKNNRQLHIQSKELVFNQAEIKRINENLEEMIEKRIEEIEAKNREIAEHAFVNAHLLRAPLTRILGLSYLIEMSSKLAPTEISKVRDRAEETDRIIKKIAKVLD